MKIFIVLSAFLAVSCGIILPGQCPDAAVVQNFDIPRYAGLWYEIYRYDTVFQPSGECVKAQYTLNEWGNVTVFNSMVARNQLSTIEGTAAPIPNANGEAKLTVYFAIGVNVASNYWVLSTDYDNYALVYSCFNLTSSRKSVSSWILSRVNYLKATSVLDLNPSLQAVDGLDWANYRWTNHSETSCRVDNKLE